MTFNGTKIITALFSLLFLLAAGWSAYRDELIFLLLPVALVIILFLVQYPVYLFYLLLITIPWSIEYNFSSGLGTDLPDEPLMLLTALSMLMVAVNRRNEQGARTSIHPIVWLLFMQFAWIVFTVMNSTEPLLSIKYILAKGWYLLAFVAAPLYFFRDEKVLRRAVVLLLISMLSFTVLAQWKHAAYGFSFEKINDALAPFYRNHVNYSALLVFMVPVLVALFQLASSGPWKYFIAAVLAFTLFAVYFSYARGAWLALLTGLPVYFLIRKKLLLATVVLFFIICLAAIFWLRKNDNYLRYAHDFETTIWHEDFREHLVATYQLKDASTAERFYRWIAGVRMVEDRPLAGFGPSTFYRNYKSYTIPAFKTWVSRNPEQSTVHNYFLLLAIEQGLTGLLLFLLLIGALFWYAQRIYHRTASKFWKVTVTAAAVILVMECTVNFLSDLIESDKTGSVFYLCVAVIIIADRKTRAEIGQEKTGAIEA